MKKLFDRSKIFYFIIFSLAFTLFSCKEKKVSLKNRSIFIIEDRKRIYDFANIVDNDNFKNMTILLDSLNKRTGANVVVVTVPTTGNLSTVEYVKDLFYNRWNIEDQKKKNGLIIFISFKEGKVHIIGGSNFEFILPPEVCREIMDDYIIPNLNKAIKQLENEVVNFYSGDGVATKKILNIKETGIFGEGLHNGVKIIALIIKRYYERHRKIDKKVNRILSARDKVVVTTDKFTQILFIIFVVLIIIILALKIIIGIRCPKCNSRLTVTEEWKQRPTRTRHGLKRKTFHCKSCGYVNKKNYIIAPVKFKLSDFFKKLVSKQNR